MAERSILLIEHDVATATQLADALWACGHRVTPAPSGQRALRAASLDPPDIIVLDLDLAVGDLDGLEICRRLRSWWTNPLVVLSSDVSDDRKVAALDAGADDYLTKPLSVAELLARLRVAERHLEVMAKTVSGVLVRLGDLVIDTAAREVVADGTPLVLTKREYDLLELLARNAGRVISYEVLSEQVWSRRGDAGAMVAQSIRVHVSKLRTKLGRGPDRPTILSDRGTGYRLVLLEAEIGPVA